MKIRTMTRPCLHHGQVKVPTNMISVCRTSTTRGDTWTMTWRCPYPGCRCIGIDDYRPTLPGWSALLAALGVRFWQAPAPFAELFDPARTAGRALTPVDVVDAIAWLVIPAAGDPDTPDGRGPDIIAAARAFRAEPGL